MECNSFRPHCSINDLMLMQFIENCFKNNCPDHNLPGTALTNQMNLSETTSADILYLKARNSYDLPKAYKRSKRSFSGIESDSAFGWGSVLFLPI